MTGKGRTKNKWSLEARGLRSLAPKNQMPNTILIDALLCWRATFWLWCQGMDLNSGQRNSLLIYTARGGNHWQFHDSRGIRQLIDASKQASKHARRRRRRSHMWCMVLPATHARGLQSPRRLSLMMLQLALKARMVVLIPFLKWPPLHPRARPDWAYEFLDCRTGLNPDLYF